MNICIISVSDCASARFFISGNIYKKTSINKHGESLAIVVPFLGGIWMV